MPFTIPNSHIVVLILLNKYFQSANTIFNMADNASNSAIPKLKSHLKGLYKCVDNDQIPTASFMETLIWAPSSEFVSSSIPSWQILTAHAQPFRGARDLAFCLKVPLDSLLVWASSEGSGETARMCRLAWTFAARIGYEYQIRLTRPNLDFMKMPIII